LYECVTVLASVSNFFLKRIWLRGIQIDGVSRWDAPCRMRPRERTLRRHAPPAPPLRLPLLPPPAPPPRVPLPPPLRQTALLLGEPALRQRARQLANAMPMAAPSTVDQAEAARAEAARAGLARAGRTRAGPARAEIARAAAARAAAARAAAARRRGRSRRVSCSSARTHVSVSDRSSACRWVRGPRTHRVVMRRSSSAAVRSGLRAALRRGVWRRECRHRDLTVRRRTDRRPTSLAGLNLPGENAVCRVESVSGIWLSVEVF
jgi:hypothetical protein